jgi:hypothetical protein
VSFPLHLLADPLCSYVAAAAKALDCDESYIAVPLVPVLASAIGNTRRIRLKATWTEPAVCWAATVGESGTVKSPGLDLAASPIWRRQRAMLRQHAQARARFDNELQAWRDMPRTDRGERPEAPEPCQHPICCDITIEALADRLLATPRGTLVQLEELSAWFGSFNQYKAGGADVAHWLTLHGARALKVDRKSGDKTTIYVPHAAVSLTGTIQPGTLRRALLPEYFENGLAARLLAVMPPTRAKKFTEHEIAPELSARVDSLFANLFALRPAPGVNGDDEPVMVDLTDSGRQSWARFVAEHNERLQELVGPERAAGAKLEGYAARFALIFHCCQQAAGEKQIDYIDATDIEAGVELAQWFGVETRRVYRAMHETQADRQRRELLQWIAGRGGRVTPRDLQRNLRRYEHDLDAAEADLNDLVDRAHGAWEYAGSGQRGRPTHVFCLADSPDFPMSRRTDADVNRKNNGQPDISSASAAFTGS